MRHVLRALPWLLCLATWADSVSAQLSSASRSLASVSLASASASASASAGPQLGARAHHGLPSRGMQVNSIYLGFLPDWTTSSPIAVNRALGAAMAIIGDYIVVSQDATSMQPMLWHSGDLVTLASTSVYAPAILPSFSLANWTQDQSNALAGTAAQLNRQGVTVWIRFAYEMNGYWNAYGLDPTNFIASFRQVAQAVRSNSGCTSTYMLWSPNVAYGATDSLQGYTPYWPGNDVVDIAGISYYWTGDNQTQNTMPGSRDFADVFQDFHDLYGQRVPLVVSESSAQYHYGFPPGFVSVGPDQEFNGMAPNISDLTPVPASGSPTELSMKQTWLTSMTSPSTAGRFPNLTAVSWFNYFKEGFQNQLLDFRATGGDPQVEAWFRSYAGNSTAYDQGYSGRGSVTGAHRTFIFSVAFITLACIV